MEPSDAELMERVSKGDQRAFALLVDRHRDPVVAYLARLTGDRGLAEDLAQETFIRLYRYAPGYSEHGKLAGYLYRIASNLAASELRRDQRRRWLRRWFLQSGNGGPPAKTPDGELERTELQAKLGRAIAALPVRFRIPLVLHEIEGLAYAEVARATGQREGTVKSRVHRGRRMLKQSLAPYVEGGGA